MHRIVDMGLPTVQIGIRSICKEKQTTEKHLTVFRAREIRRSRIGLNESPLSPPKSISHH